MNLEEVLNFRRSVRRYDKNKPIDPEKVKHCLELATLAPNSSNMQLWEFYQITNPGLMAKVSEACLGQSAASTASEIVVFVTRQDLYKKRAKFVLDFEEGNIRRNSPKERQEKRIRDRKLFHLCKVLRASRAFQGDIGENHQPVPPYDAGSFGMRYACDGK